MKEWLDSQGGTVNKTKEDLSGDCEHKQATCNKRQGTSNMRMHQNNKVLGGEAPEGNKWMEGREHLNSFMGQHQTLCLQTQAQN